MTEIRKEKITRLAIDAFEKREMLEGFKKTPVPDNYASKQKNAVEFALAMTESIEAEGLLRQEMGISPQGFPQN